MKLVRHNAWATLEGAESWFLNYLSRHLSVPVEPNTPQGFRFGAMWTAEDGQRCGTLVKGTTVPGGLAPHVLRLAAHYGLPCAVQDARERPDEHVPLWSVRAHWRPYQDHVHAQLVRHEVGVVDVVPRGGKTLMSARIIDVLNLPTAVVAPSVAIVRQTYERFRTWFGKDLVARVDGDARPDERDVEKRIVVLTAASALAQEPAWWATRRVLAIDEFHHAAADTYHRINALATNAYYRYGLTGTFFRTGDDHLAMEAIASYVLAKVDTNYLVSQGYLAPPQSCFFPIHARGRGGDNYQEIYAKNVVDHDYRNMVVAQLANALVKSGEPTIVLVRQRAHAERLADEIVGAVAVKGGEGALTSASIGDFLGGRVSCLVGTTVIGEGVDLPPASSLVFASAGSDGVSMAQAYYRPLTAHDGKKVGRVYDFVDHHHGQLRKHSENRIGMAQRLFGESRVFYPR